MAAGLGCKIEHKRSQHQVQGHHHKKQLESEIKNPDSVQSSFEMTEPVKMPPSPSRHPLKIDSSGPSDRAVDLRFGSREFEGS